MFQFIEIHSCSSGIFMSKKIRFIILSLWLTSLSGPVYSDILDCKLTNYRALGSTIADAKSQNFIKNRLGTEFKIDTAKNTLQVAVDGKWRPKVKISLSYSAANYKIYKHTVTGVFKDTSQKFRLQFSHRINTNGTARVTQTQSGNFLPVQASGNCKKLPIKPKIEKVKKASVIDKTNTALEIQKQLNRLGCNVGYPDGVIGAKSKRGLKAFAKANKTFVNNLDVSVFSNKQFLNFLKLKPNGFCD